MNHIMLDIETLGREPGCVILSIGAVRFDPYSNRTGWNTFYRNIYVPSCYEIGLVSETETLAWWNEQDIEARKHLDADQVFIRDALRDLIEWLDCDDETRIWCQGATFDAPILRQAIICSGIALDAPWKFWGVRDTRTVYDVCGFDPKTVERQGTFHNALHDAMHQVRCVQAALNPRPWWKVVWDEIKEQLK